MICLFAEYVLDEFLMLVCCAEKRLYADLALLSSSVVEDLDTASGDEFAVKGSFLHFAAVVEIKLF